MACLNIKLDDDDDDDCTSHGTARKVRYLNTPINQDDSIKYQDQVVNECLRTKVPSFHVWCTPKHFHPHVPDQYPYKVVYIET